MDEIASALVWASGTEESVAEFYISAFTASCKNNVKSFGEPESVAGKIAESIARLLSIYGRDGDHKSVVIKYGPADENNGFWTFDVRFTVKGQPKQFLAAGKSLADINKSLNGEIALFIRGMNAGGR